VALKYFFALAMWSAAALFVAEHLGWVSPQSVGVVGLSVVLLGIAGTWFFDRLERRLAAIAKAADQLAQGMDQVRLDSPKGDDIASLTQAFNRMSEQTQARMQELQLSLQQQRALTEHGPDAMWVFHVETFQLIDVNQNFLELLDLPRDKVIGRTPMDLSAPIQEGGVETRAYAEGLIRRVLQGEKIIVPWVVRTRTGLDVPCEMRAIHLPTQQGKTLICGSLMDARERLRAQDELRHRLEFEALITRLSSDVASLTWERLDDGVQRALADLGRFAQVDRSYIFVFDEGGAQVTCTHEWCAPGIPAQIGRLQSLLVADYPWVEERLLRGEVVHVPRVAEVPAEARAERKEWEAEAIRSILLVPIRTGGRVSGYVGFDAVTVEKAWPTEAIDLLRIFGEILFNTRTRLHAEEALRQKAEALSRANAELEASNVELQQFAYIASHDLQEPLRTISSFSELLQRRYRADLDDNARGFLDLVSAAAQRMHALINGLLDYSRIESRARPFERCDLNEVLRGALANLDASIRDARATVTHDSLPVVMGDPSQLAQVFQNLVGNAIKFHEERAPRVHISAQPGRRADEGWLLSVRDNGIGIAPADFPRLFQVFKRLHGVDKYPGTGIGLASCKRIVERHRGRIWAEANGSEPGATFYFTLPVTAEGLLPAPAVDETRFGTG